MTLGLPHSLQKPTTKFWGKKLRPVTLFSTLEWLLGFGQFCLVGGLEHDFFPIFTIYLSISYAGDVILPIDELHHFSRW